MALRSLSRAEAGEGDRDLEHLILKDDRAERLPQHRFERGVIVGHNEIGVLPYPLLPGDVRIDRSALDRTGTDDRDLDGDVLQILGAGATQ
jgi:hypothetical protein